MLRQNYPNPFNPETTISFVVAPDGNTSSVEAAGVHRTVETQVVSLTVFNALGQRVAGLLDEAPLSAGLHRVRWDGRDAAGRPAASGVYFYSLRVGAAGSSRHQLVRRMLLLR